MDEQAVSDKSNKTSDNIMPKRLQNDAAIIEWVRRGDASTLLAVDGSVIPPECVETDRCNPAALLTPFTFNRGPFPDHYQRSFLGAKGDT